MSDYVWNKIFRVAAVINWVLHVLMLRLLAVFVVLTIYFYFEFYRHLQVKDSMGLLIDLFGFIMSICASASFRMVLLPSSLTSYFLLAATRSGITYQNAQDTFECCYTLFMNNLKITILPGLFYLAANEYVLAILHFLPVLSQVLTMIPMFVLMYQGEDYWREARVNEQAQEISLT